jgi:hypothetical protein
MPMWLIQLRDIVWPAVGAVVLAVIGIVCAIAAPSALALPVAFGLGSVSLALLAQRA